VSDLLTGYEIQLMFEPLLILAHSGHRLVQGQDLLAVLQQQLVPHVHLPKEKKAAAAFNKL
jgi:hypothetical protein